MAWTRPSVRALVTDEHNGHDSRGDRLNRSGRPAGVTSHQSKAFRGGWSCRSITPSRDAVVPRRSPLRPASKLARRRQRLWTSAASRTGCLGWRSTGCPRPPFEDAGGGRTAAASLPKRSTHPRSLNAWLSRPSPRPERLGVGCHSQGRTRIPSESVGVTDIFPVGESVTADIDVNLFRFGPHSRGPGRGHWAA